ncbi:MAG TPA: metal-dependent transcriptional regulator [Acidimicrobiales bacterium]|nr:metal-dependent transcriptional regulator [Acidimicrobiales bacterium]
MSATADHLGAHPPTEQYLAAIYVLGSHGEAVIQARLAERVGHTAPTVSEMVHRLKEAGYITAQGRELRLTSTGRGLAESVLRKHCLAARLLAEVIGLPWHLVHAEADRWEHVISDDVAARLAEVLGNPTTCPHGCPIPGLCTQMGPTSALADAKVGQRARLVQLDDPAKFDLEALAYLEANHFLPGCEATVAAEGPDGSLVLSVGEHNLVMGVSMAKRLRVVLSA